MSETTTTDVVDKDVTTTTAADTTTATTTAADTTATTTTAADTTTTTAADTTTTTAEKVEATIPDNWRELAAGNDEKIATLLKRYGSLNGVAKALKEKEDLIRSGKVKRDMPDPKDEKAMGEWRKEQGIPDDPTGYKLPDAIVKRLTDEDKPVLANFTEFAHAKNAPPAFVEMAAEWYLAGQEAAATKMAEDDAAATEAAEDELRKDWAQAEYKGNFTLAKRFMEEIPVIGKVWSEARLPNGRRLGDYPEFIAWASDEGRNRYGDVTFATTDTEAKHTARKAEIEKVMSTDIGLYHSSGMDKEYTAILEKEERRKK
jgi:hypothetical protein